MTSLFEIRESTCLRAEFLAVSDVSVAREASIVVPIHCECVSVVELVSCCKGGDAVVDISDQVE